MGHAGSFELQTQPCSHEDETRVNKYGFGGLEQAADAGSEDCTLPAKSTRKGTTMTVVPSHNRNMNFLT